ncbi:MAG TPA: hypothetical protein VNS63_13940 [Blastocatellia bacterium]|nr:hypothetical protein [Blastocatellia bacterium]
MLKRTAAIVLSVVFLSLAVAPEALSCDRARRNRYAPTVGRRYDAPYRYTGVAGERYYNDRSRDGFGSPGRAILTIGAPAAIGAGLGAIVGGKKGAGVGALLGGGGGAAYYLLRHQGRR